MVYWNKVTPFYCASYQSSMLCTIAKKLFETCARYRANQLVLYIAQVSCLCVTSLSHGYLFLLIYV